jgi:hypothetical protein
MEWNAYIVSVAAGLAYLVLGVRLLWLAFFAPAAYRRRIERSAA